MRYYLYLFITLVLTGFCSCDETFDLNSDWEDITIVYSLLSETDTAHYIKVNKAFLGDGNAYEMAGYSDSIQYLNAVDVRLLEYRLKDTDLDPYGSANWERTTREDIILSRTDEIEKDTSGIFGSQNNYLYKSTESLGKLKKYILEIRIPGKEELVKAETFMIGNTGTSRLYTEYPRVNVPGTFNPPIRTEFYDRVQEMKWQSLVYGKRYEPVLRFKYLEIIGTDTAQKYVDIVYRSQDVSIMRLPNEYEGETMSQSFGGENFYFNIGSKIEEIPGAKRKALGLDFIFYVGSEDLNTYLSSSQGGGFDDGTAEFTNIDNGKGIFASRFVHIVPDKAISDEGIDSLAYGYYTKHLNFANFQGIWTKK